MWSAAVSQTSRRRLLYFQRMACLQRAAAGLCHSRAPPAEVFPGATGTVALLILA